jgi:hypothetical protein
MQSVPPQPPLVGIEPNPGPPTPPPPTTGVSSAAQLRVRLSQVRAATSAAMRERRDAGIQQRANQRQLAPNTDPVSVPIDPLLDALDWHLANIDSLLTLTDAQLVSLNARIEVLLQVSSGSHTRSLRAHDDEDALLLLTPPV